MSSSFAQSNEKRNFSEIFATFFLPFLTPRYAFLICVISFSRSSSSFDFGGSALAADDEAPAADDDGPPPPPPPYALRRTVSRCSRSSSRTFAMYSWRCARSASCISSSSSAASASTSAAAASRCALLMNTGRPISERVACSRIFSSTDIGSARRRFARCASAARSTS